MDYIIVVGYKQTIRERFVRVSIWREEIYMKREKEKKTKVEKRRRQ